MLAERALIDSVANETGDTLVVVCYHASGPYMIPKAKEREDFYNTGYTEPFVVFDGTDAVFEPDPNKYDSIYNIHYQLARTNTPYYNLTIDSAITEPSIARFKLKIVAADSIPSGEINAFVAITEDSLRGAYGTFYRVCRALYEFPVELQYPDSMIKYFEFSHNIPASKMRATVFIQNKGTKEVMQTISTKFEEAK
ncbi:MAG: hypothetical protein N3A65_02725 [candidate division WOR-3 bacterium]|nr:hypothetical protein [candidate division WOR-3 bacterium]